MMLIRITQSGPYVSALGHRVHTDEGGTAELKRRVLDTLSHRNHPPDALRFVLPGCDDSDNLGPPGVPGTPPRAENACAAPATPAAALPAPAAPVAPPAASPPKAPSAPPQRGKERRSR